MAVIGGQMGREAYPKGDLEGAIIACGQCVGLVHEMKSVREVIEEIMSGAEALLDRLNAIRS